MGLIIEVFGWLFIIQWVGVGLVVLWDSLDEWRGKNKQVKKRKIDKTVWERYTRLPLLDNFPQPKAFSRFI